MNELMYKNYSPKIGKERPLKDKNKRAVLVNRNSTDAAQGCWEN